MFLLIHLLFHRAQTDSSCINEVVTLYKYLLLLLLLLLLLTQD